MKNSFLSYLVLAIGLLSFPAFSQTEGDTTLLDLPGDNLDLFGVLDLFQKSPTIEDFEKSINLEESAINNLDLDLDGKVDFIKVVTKQDGADFTFILQVDISEKEVQDVAVILVSKDKSEKVTMQIIGDKDLYGKDYVIEPQPAAPAVTANPAYTGTAPVASTPATTTVVVVESAPIVQYVYSPVYVPYYPPYTYAYHPPYFAAFTVVAVSVYHHNHYYPPYGYHGGYHGGYGHGNTVVIHNTNNYNNYNNNSRNTSNTVNRNNANGNYNNNRSSASTRPSTTASTNQSRPSASPAARPSTSPSTSQSRPSASPAARPSTSPSTSQSRPSSAPAARPSTSPSTSQSRPSSAPAARPSTSPSRSMSPSPSRSGGGGRRR